MDTKKSAVEGAVSACKSVRTRGYPVPSGNRRGGKDGSLALLVSQESRGNTATSLTPRSPCFTLKAVGRGSKEDQDAVGHLERLTGRGLGDGQQETWEGRYCGHSGRRHDGLTQSHGFEGGDETSLERS